MADADRQSAWSGLPWHYAAAFWTIVVFAAAPVAAFVLRPEEPIARLALNLLCLHGLGLVLVFLELRRRVPPGARRDALWLRRFAPSAVLEAVLWLAMVLPLVWLTAWASFSIIRELGMEPPVNPLVDWLRHGAWPVTVLVAVSAVAVAPLAEELFFRVAIYRVVSERMGGVAGMVFTSLLFAAIHLSLATLAPLFVLAMVLQLAYLRSRNLWVPMLIHAGFNGTVVALALLARALGVEVQ